MLTVQGDVSILGLAHLVRGLAGSRASGLLLVEARLERRVIRVSPGGLRLVRGSLRCHRFERRLREAALRPEPAAAARLMGEWMLAEIAELLTWTQGSFRFHPFLDEAVAGEEGPFGAYGADLDVERTLAAAARWADELPRLKAAIPDLRHVPVRTSAGPLPLKEGIEAEAMEDILRLVDGRRPVIHVLQQAVFPRLVVLRVLSQLLAEGLLRLEVPGRLALAAAA